jgi:DNA polymerase III subunit delta'
MFFADIIGQLELKQKLVTSVRAGRIPHAMLFSGPEGTGALPLAIAFARYVSCTGNKDQDACGECLSCRKFDRLAHPDLHFSFPVNATSKKTDDKPVSDDFIAEWREYLLSNPYFRTNSWYNFIGLENKQGLINKDEGKAIVRKLSLKSYESDYKFMIIWLPEKMHPTVSNMLLKLIEEPPEKTLFLMVSENPEQLLMTILSRTQPVRLGTIKEEEMSSFIGSRYEISGEKLRGIVRLAGGNYIKALEILSNSDEYDYYLECFTGIMRMCYKRDYFAMNDLVEELSGIGRERQKAFFEYALRILRENFVLNLKRDEIVYQTEKELNFSGKFHPFINGNNVLQLYHQFNQASNDIERNGYSKIILFDLCLHIMKLIRK